MTVNDSCYGDALRALARNRFVFCIPGWQDGEPVVSVASYPAGNLSRDEQRFVHHPDARVRAAFLFGAMRVARRDARAHGVEV